MSGLTPRGSRERGPDQLSYTTSRDVSGGVAAARNIGLAAATMEWVGFNDQDDIWYPGRLQRQVTFLETHEEALGVAGGAGRLAADDKSLWTGRFLWLRWTPILKVRLSNSPFYDPRRDGTTYLQTLIVRLEVARSVGGFNEHLPLADDLDFALKVANVATLGWVAGPMFLYRLGHHNQTAPGNADAKRFLGAQAFYLHAQAARTRGEPEPDARQFMREFQPSRESVANFHVAQTVRYLNTVWVYRGLLAAILVGLRILVTHPVLFARHVSERIRWWKNRERV
jgi:hypothetical protein